MLDIGVGIGVHPTGKILQKERELGPLQHHYNRSVVHAGDSAPEVSEKNPRVFSITSTEHDRSGVTRF